jgi:hypothetical protein
MRVTRLSVTPIKGLQLHHPDEIRVTTVGAAGDRRFFLVSDSDRPFSITKSGALTHFRAVYDDATDWLALEAADGRRWEGSVVRGEPIATDFDYADRYVHGHVVEGPWADVLAEAVGRKVRLVCADRADPGFDVHPVTLLGTASVQELAEKAGLPHIDSRRFRMLIEFETEEPHVEDTWQGRGLLLGSAELAVGGGVPRCAAVTRHPDNGTRDVPVVKLIKRYRGLTDGEHGPGVRFGVYADVVSEGIVRVGDAVTLV